MIKMNRKKLGILLQVLIVSFVLIGGCTCHKNSTKPEPDIQIIKDISAKEAYDLIQNNKDNPNFIIIDARTREEFADEHIENAINLDYYSETFRDELNKLDKNKIYLIYCRTGRRTGLALDIMEELGFREVYNMLGGITQWKEEGFPTVK